MKQSRQELMDNIEVLMELKIREAISNQKEEYVSMIKQQKVVIDACLNIILIETKTEIVDTAQQICNQLVSARLEEDTDEQSFPI